ncbi:MAG: hypothetical protein ACRCXZ_07815 [Patescibacteria group bacterium]
MFFDLKRNYDNAIKDLELEIRDLESKILEHQFNLELMKNNSIISDNEKEQYKFRYSLKYDREDFTIQPEKKSKDSNDLPINNSEREQTQ